MAVMASPLAGRIQGFGNVNPPPLEEETKSNMAKRALGAAKDAVAKDVALTVQEFKEKGAVGVVKDTVAGTVADAGGVLIGGVSGIVGWVRGTAPVEEQNENTKDATKKLSNGPSDAAYGVSQASRTGGINAVWVMPNEADPQTLATLASQQGGMPKNIQPYQPASKTQAMPQPQIGGMQLPGGPVIAPYQPAPAGLAGLKMPPCMPGVPSPSRSSNQWGPSGYNATSAGSCSNSTPSGLTGAKGLIDRIAKGEVLVGQDVVKRLISQCNATKTTSKQLAEIVCERSRRLYLGLDGGESTDADVALLRLLELSDNLAQHDSEIAKVAVPEITKGVQEEFLSLRSNAKHKDTAEPMLRRLGLLRKPVDSTLAATTDLLGAGIGGTNATTQSVREANLLGSDDGHAAVAVTTGDLLGTTGSGGFAGVATLDPLAPAGPAADSSLLGGLTTLDVPPTSGVTVSSQTGMPFMPLASTTGPMGGMGSGPSAFAMSGSATTKDKDAFDFVGAELSKASTAMNLRCVQ